MAKLTDQQRDAVMLIALAGPGTDENLAFTDIADKVGVGDSTLRRWRNTPEFQEELDRVCDESREASVDQIHDMLLRHAVQDGSHQHAKLYMDLFGPRENSDDSKFDTLFDMSDRDLEGVRWKIYDHMKGLPRPADYPEAATA